MTLSFKKMSFCHHMLRHVMVYGFEIKVEVYNDFGILFITVSC